MTQTQVAEAWSHVTTEMPYLERLAKRIARRDSRVVQTELLHDLALDLVESYGLFDPSRGAYRSWAAWRSRLAYLRYARRLARSKREAGRLQLGEPPKDAEEGDWFEPSSPVGSYGTPARMEALIDLDSVYTLAGEDEQTDMIRELYGLRRRRD